MPKVTIEFTLPEDQEAYDLAMNSNKYYNALRDITKQFRELRKYGQVNETTWCEAEELIWKLIREEGISEL